MDLTQVVRVLSELAPLQLAAEWDNVGLLLEPARVRPVQRVLLTIDLTEAVLREAVQQRSDLIVAYHPPIFAGVKRLTQSTALERALLGAIAADIAVYSPHTALDAVSGGVNDWLAEAFGPSELRAIEPAAHSVAPPRLARHRTARRKPGHRQHADCQGQGRLLRLRRPMRLDVALRRIKRHLGVKHLRLALPQPHPTTITTVALCPGAGGAVLAGVEADLLLTGEMRHHDVLAALARGSAVVLSEHSVSERGYLPRLSRRLRALTGRSLEVRVAREDREPLAIF
jgi:dinuclear metal center YbgI/SA1388 family protein